MGFFFYVIHPHTLSTAHASRTHVKAPQTDLHGKPDNSSGPTHDSPSERPLRTKATSQPKKAPKSIEDTKPREDHPSQARTDSPQCPDQIGYRDQGPKGNIETQTGSSSLLRAMEEASKTSGQTPWLNTAAIEGSEAWSIGIGLRLSLWKERLSLSFSLLSLSN